MSSRLSFRRVRFDRKRVAQTLAKMGRQLDETHDVVCEELDALLEVVDHALRASQDAADPASALEDVQGVLSPWGAGERATTLRVALYALQVFWQQNIKSLRNDLIKGTPWVAGQEAGTVAAAKSKKVRRQERRTQWQHEAEIIMDDHPCRSRILVAFGILDF